MNAIICKSLRTYANVVLSEVQHHLHSIFRHSSHTCPSVPIELNLPHVVGGLRRRKSLFDWVGVQGLGLHANRVCFIHLSDRFGRAVAPHYLHLGDRFGRAVSTHLFMVRLLETRFSIPLLVSQIIPRIEHCISQDNEMRSLGASSPLCRSKNCMKERDQARAC